MSYEQELAVHLRIRAVPERVIEETLADVREVTDAGDDPRQHFGAPEDYAQTFPQGRTTLRQRGPLYLGTAAAAAWILGSLMARKAGWNPPGRLDQWTLLPALGLLMIGMLVSFASNFRASKK